MVKNTFAETCFIVTRKHSSLLLKYEKYSLIILVSVKITWHNVIFGVHLGYYSFVPPTDADRKVVLIRDASATGTLFEQISLFIRLKISYENKIFASCKNHVPETNVSAP